MQYATERMPSLFHWVFLFELIECDTIKNGRALILKCVQLFIYLLSLLLQQFQFRAVPQSNKHRTMLSDACL